MNFNEACDTRASTLDDLITSAEGIASAGAYTDMLAAVQMVELAAERARRAIITEAIAAGEQWSAIGIALHITGAEAETRYRHAP